MHDDGDVLGLADAHRVDGVRAVDPAGVRRGVLEPGVVLRPLAPALEAPLGGRDDAHDVVRVARRAGPGRVARGDLVVLVDRLVGLRRDGELHRVAVAARDRADGAARRRDRPAARDGQLSRPGLEPAAVRLQVQRDVERRSRGVVEARERQVLERPLGQPAGIGLDGAVEDRVVLAGRGARVRLERDVGVGHAEAAAVRRGRRLVHGAALRRVGRGALDVDLLPDLLAAGRLALHVAGRPRVRRVVAGPDAGDRVEVGGGRREAGGAVRRRERGPRGRGRGRAAAGEDLLDLPGVERVRALELLREHVRIGRRLDALPDVAAGLLVVAVAGVQRRGEPDVDLGLRHADDPRHPPQRLVLAPEELRQRRVRVVEEVDAVEVEDVDRAGAVVGDAVLVLAAEAERRADLGADGVAAALAARDHDDPALGVVALVPDTARADDARVVVRMRPLAEHVQLDGPRGRVPVGRRCGRRHGHRGRGHDEEPQEPLQHCFPLFEQERTSPNNLRQAWGP